jgi:hypothetical protein
VYSYTKAGSTVTHNTTDLQHWFLAFSNARNAVIHKGVVPKLRYRGARSRYNGHFVDVGERLLRESIKVSMVGLGYSNIWRSQLWRAIDKSLRGRGR